MKQPTSLFNFAVFKSDIKRFWWLSALHTIFIFVSSLLPFYINNCEEIRANLLSYNKPYLRSELLDYTIFPYLILAVISVGMAVLLFSYLNSKSAVAQIHAVPVRRETLFITHNVFGVCALIVPVLINAVILFAFRSNPYIAQTLGVSHILWWTYTQISYAIIGFSFAVFIGMFTANSVAHIVFTYIFAFLPFAVEIAVRALMEMHLHGYYFYGAGAASTTCRFLYFGIEKMATVKYPLIYILYSVILLGASLFVYKKRNLENTAEVIAFPELKTVFVYGVSICMGIAGYFYLAAITKAESMFLVLPFGVLGVIIANMVAKKAFTFKGIIKPSIALLISAIIFAMLFEADITGFEKRVPDISDVESVALSRQSVQNIKQLREINGAERIERGAYIPYLTENEDIENIIKLHDVKKDDKETKRKHDPIYITYNLKNGKTMVRKYLVNLKAEQELLAPIFETEEYKKYALPVSRGEYENILTAQITDPRCGEYAHLVAEKAEDAALIERLGEALKKDIENVKYEEFAFNENEFTTIEIQVLTPWYYEGTDTVVSKEIHSRYGTYSDFYYYQVHPSYENTIAVLTEMGFYNAIPAPESYNKVNIRVHDYRIAPENVTENTPLVTVKKYSKEEGEEPDAVIDNPEDISELYKYITETPTNRYDAVDDENGYVEFNLEFKGDNVKTFVISRTSHDENLPECLKELIK